MQMFSIGQAARLAGIGAETIRFYEKEGLLDAPMRTESGYRKYTKQSISRLHFIRQAKYLGFTLKEIKELLLLLAESRDTCKDVQQRAKLKLAEVEQKIAHLQALRLEIVNAVALCNQENNIDTCPILDILEHEHIQDLLSFKD